MIRAVIARKLDAAEREIGQSVDYLRDMVRASLPGFLKFSRVFSLARHRRALPPPPWHVARIVATRDEDCGPCVQIVVDHARRDGVAPDVLAAVLARRPEDLPAELADAYRFADAVVQATGDDGPLRERIRARWGDEALVDLAIGIAVCRVFPITKRALGHGTSCALFPVHA